MKFQTERAQALYDEALALLPAADRRAQKPGLMMASIYRTLLCEIEASGFQVLHQRIALTRCANCGWRGRCRRLDGFKSPSTTPQLHISLTSATPRPHFMARACLWPAPVSTPVYPLRQRGVLGQQGLSRTQANCPHWRHTHRPPSCGWRPGSARLGPVEIEGDFLIQPTGTFRRLSAWSTNSGLRWSSGMAMRCISTVSASASKLRHCPKAPTQGLGFFAGLWRVQSIGRRLCHAHGRCTRRKPYFPTQ